jgi:hypothetical protein
MRFRSLKPGYCEICWRPERAEIEALMRAGRLPYGSLARFGLSRRQAEYHRKHLGRRERLVYFRPEEWLRRKRSVEHILMWERRWKPGQSGNPAGRPKARDKRPRSRGRWPASP